ncbi:MAG: ferredoxin [Lachnospiraceae bacterium]
MKQIKVNEKCNGCGLCIVNSPYLQENDEGNAQPVPGKTIKDIDLKEVEKVVEECPEKALSIIDTGKATVSGKAGVNQIIDVLKKQCDSINIKKVGNSDVKLDVKKYSINLPCSNKEYRRDYTSESSAKSAAKEEFNRLCYSENAYRPLIKKVFVEYKVNVLKPYYNCEDVPESAYYKYNEIARKQLADVYAEICELVGDNKLPASWKEFSVYPKNKDWIIEALKEFDERSTASGIISSMKDISHTDLNSYISDMDFDYDEQYAGEGLFGKTKYKNMWYFSGFNSAAKSFLDDLTWAIEYMSSDIEKGAAELINIVFKTFEEELKKTYNDKIEELKKIV